MGHWQQALLGIITISPFVCRNEGWERIPSCAPDTDLIGTTDGSEEIGSSIRNRIAFKEIKREDLLRVLGGNSRICHAKLGHWHSFHGSHFVERVNKYHSVLLESKEHHSSLSNRAGSTFNARRAGKAVESTPTTIIVPIDARIDHVSAADAS